MCIEILNREDLKINPRSLYKISKSYQEEKIKNRDERILNLIFDKFLISVDRVVIINEAVTTINIFLCKWVLKRFPYDNEEVLKMLILAICYYLSGGGKRVYRLIEKFLQSNVKTLYSDPDYIKSLCPNPQHQDIICDLLTNENPIKSNYPSYPETYLTILFEKNMVHL